MKLNKKHLSAAIAITLMLTMAATLVTAVTFGQTFTKAPFTQACVSISPKISGLGDSPLITGWVNPPREVSGEVYLNYTFVITKPDGTKDIQYFEHSNQDATWSFHITVDQVGTWHVYLIFNGDTYHDPATSPDTPFYVQEVAPPNTNPSVPLPTGFWWWPINGQNYEWYQISGDWPNAWHDASGTCMNPYSKAPNTPHVLWVEPLTGDSLIGGDQGATSNQVDAPVIVTAMGRMYYRYGEGIGSDLHPVVVCLDQLTGQVIWKRDMPCDTSRPSSGGSMALDIVGREKSIIETVIDVNKPVQTVSVPARYNLWMVGNGIWQIDPYSGNCKYYLSCSAQSSTGKGGGLLMDENGYLYLTNYPSSSNITKWDGNSHSIVWTIVSPTVVYGNQSTGGTSGFGQPWLGGSSQDGEVGDIWFGNSRPTGGVPYGIAFTSVNTTTGQVIVKEQIMANGVYPTTGYQGGFSYGHVIMHAIDRYWYCNDLATGQQLWKSDFQSEYPWGSFGMYMSCSGYGIYYQGQYDGYLYAINETNGHLVWKFFTGNNTDIVSGANIPWGRQCIADGKIYFLTGEHDVANPYPRGNTLYCLNAYTGELIWKVIGFQDRGASGGQTAGISSGMFYTYNLYDGRLWMFGKGPTTTTVSASPGAIAEGASVLIQGTVLDESPASAGQPAISDADMEAWTEYLHEQNQVFPANAKGVVVHLQAMGSDGTLMDVTHVTTDTMGHYEYTWTPPAQDTYKIIATFEGSESYWTSADQTGLSVGPTAPTPAPPQAAPDNTPILVGIIVATVAIIIALAIVGMLVLRKRP